MTYRIVAIDSRGYRPLPAMAADTTEQAALRELVRLSTVRTAAVVLRDGLTGRRTCVADAMRALGISGADKWQPEKWLARTEAA